SSACQRRGTTWPPPPPTWAAACARGTWSSPWAPATCGAWRRRSRRRAGPAWRRCRSRTPAPLPRVEAARMSGSSSPTKVRTVPLADFTTVKVGGEAELWEVEDEAGLREATSEPYRILGGGSNLLVSDDGVP